MKIENAVVLVTGANRGIGKEFVAALRQAGAAKIYAGARKVESLQEIVATDPEKIIPIQLDIADEKSVSDAATRCQDVTLLINNAGVGFDAGLISAPDLSQAKAEMEINYFGTLMMCRAFAPILKANSGGAIVNIVSSLALVNLPLRGGYSASKAAALSMTQAVRAELAAQKTLVVAVMPGAVDTQFSQNSTKPKTDPSDIVAAALQAVIDEVEDVYPGEEAQNTIAQISSDRKALEKQFAQQLPTPSK